MLSGTASHIMMTSVLCSIFSQTQRLVKVAPSQGQGHQSTCDDAVEMRHMCCLSCLCLSRVLVRHYSSVIALINGFTMDKCSCVRAELYFQAVMHAVLQTEWSGMLR